MDSLNSFLNNNVIRLNRKSCQRERRLNQSVKQAPIFIELGWRTEMNVRIIIIIIHRR